MAIFVTGDTHGSESYGRRNVDGFLRRFNTQNFPEQKKLTKNDYVIICGDFGGIWDFKGESKAEKYALDWLETRNFTTLFLPGNHENYDRLLGLEPPELIDSWMYFSLSYEEKQKLLSGYPKKAWNGGFVRELRPSVLMLERGYIFDINGKKCFAFGGASSHDISGGILRPEDYETRDDAKKEYKELDEIGLSFRVNHFSWWERELPSQIEMEMGLAMLEDEKYKVDFIFTHDCPSSLSAMMNCKTDELNNYLESLKRKVEYKHWFFGHHHINHTFPGGRDHALYEQVIRIV